MAKNESQNSSSIVNFDQSLIQGTPNGLKQLRKGFIQPQLKPNNEECKTLEYEQNDTEIDDNIDENDCNSSYMPFLMRN